MSSAVHRASVATLAFSLVFAVTACHRSAPNDAAQTAECRYAQVPDDGRIHIDGPQAFRLLRGDSLVVIVNDREWWRGVYDPCARPDELAAVLRRAVPGTDSVLSAQVLIGRSAVAPYHVGGEHPDVLLVRTAPPPD